LTANVLGITNKDFAKSAMANCSLKYKKNILMSLVVIFFDWHIFSQFGNIWRLLSKRQTVLLLMDHKKRVFFDIAT
jgi:hypothetical protein